MTMSLWRRARAGFTLIEILVLAIILGMLFVFGMGQLGRVRITTNEQLALSSVGVISKACQLYAVVNGTYPPNLVSLGPMASNPAYIDARLAHDPATKQGYIFTFTGGGASFTLRANPVRHGATGFRHFYMDQGFVVHATSQNRDAVSSDPAVS